MPIVLNGDTFDNGGTAMFGNTELSSIQVSLNGAEPVEVWKRSITVTDLVRWTSWNKQGAVNQGAEGNAGASTGLQIVSGVSSAGRAPGKASQTISMINGHKYWLYYGTYTMNSTSVVTPLGNKTLGSGTQTTNEVVTYTGATGNREVSAAYSGSDDTGSAYSRLCSMNIVDLTAAFGAGNEPTASWCNTNIGIFDGSKTITP